MEKKVIIGIDVSKSWLDAHVLLMGSQEGHALRIHNTVVGLTKLIKFINKQTKVNSDDWLFCMEHTGVYSYGLNSFLQERSIPQSMVNALAIKRSMGIIRGKNDKADAWVIAQYAVRFQDSLPEFHLPTESLQKLQLSQRERMVDMKRQVDLAMESIPGVGPQTSANILVTTQGMKLFSDSRKYACYCGVAPFEYTSGSRYRGKTKVHYLANHKMKSLLHMAALNASVYSPEIKLYYERKKAEGKNPMSILNAIRFKLIDRVFAVVKRNELYDKNFLRKAA